MGRRAVDLEALSVTELLAPSAAAVGELRRRRVVRTGNAPLGDYAEWLAAKALGGELAPNSERSFDLLTPDDRRLQVKARRVSDPASRWQLQTSPFRTWDFDEALFILVDEDSFEVRRGSLVPLWVVDLSVSRERIDRFHGRQPDGSPRGGRPHRSPSPCSRQPAAGSRQSPILRDFVRSERLLCERLRR